MSGSDQQDKDLSLSDKIEELESLLEQQEGSTDALPESENETIPVLDELVRPEDYLSTQIAAEKPLETTGELDYLAQKLEEKLSTELDDVLDTLKGRLKNSIMAELRTELSETPEINTSHDHPGSSKNES